MVNYVIFVRILVSLIDFDFIYKKNPYFMRLFETSKKVNTLRY